MKKLIAVVIVQQIAFAVIAIESYRVNRDARELAHTCAATHEVDATAAKAVHMCVAFVVTDAQLAEINGCLTDVVADVARAERAP